MENSFMRIEGKLQEVIEPGAFPIILGGDHAVSLPVLRSLFPKYGKMSHLHFDSHTDFYEGTAMQPHTHATTFRTAANEGLIDTETSVQVGIRGSIATEAIEEVRAAGYNVITMDEISRIGIDATLRSIRETVKGPVYVSLDIDVVDPAFAPGTGVPEPGGVLSREMIALIRGIGNINAVGFDLVEVSPPYDSNEITSILGANIIWEYMKTLVE